MALTGTVSKISIEGGMKIIRSDRVKIWRLVNFKSLLNNWPVPRPLSEGEKKRVSVKNG